MTARIEPPMYELIDTLGQGGMGTVYRARRRLPLDDSMDVAVKVVRIKNLESLRVGPESRPEDDSEEQKQARRLFQREGKESLLLNHEHLNLVTVFDYGISAKGYGFLILELVDGLSLRELMPRIPVGAEQGERLPFEVVRRTMCWSRWTTCTTGARSIGM